MRSYIFSVFYSWGTLILQHRQQGIILWLLFFCLFCFVFVCLVWVSVLQRNRTGMRYIWFITGNWFTWLWRLRSPMVGHLQAGDTGKLMVQFWAPEGCWFKYQLKGDAWGPSSNKQNLNPRFSTFLIYSGLQWIEWYLLTLGRAVCFPQSNNPNSSLIWSSTTDAPRNNV